MAQAELFADEYKVDLDVFEKQKGPCWLCWLPGKAK